MATFSDATSLTVSSYSTFSEFAVTDTTLSKDILDTFASPAGFAGYDMKHDLAAVNGGAAYTTGALFATDLGSFGFTKTGGGVSFVAASTPEPSSLLMTTLGFVGALASWRRWNRSRVQPVVSA